MSLFLNDFTIEAWVALGAYPTHVCPIVDNKIDSDIGYHNGYSFNIDALGRLSFLVATDGKTEELVANETLPLNQWTHGCCLFNRRWIENLYRWVCCSNKASERTFYSSRGDSFRRICFQYIIINR